MLKSYLSLAAVVGLLTTGCAKRSISQARYYGNSPQPFATHGAPANAPDLDYRGELSEFDVLGISPGLSASEMDIQRALDQSKQVKLREGASILLIQSGETYPDAPMVKALEQKFSVVPFSGVPAHPGSHYGVSYRGSESYSRSLRLVAARGGNEFIVCYWGIIESGKENLVTKTVSWVPGVNWMLPDELQHMRIRLKVALINVRTGEWTIFSPEAVEDKRIARSPKRVAVDQKLVEELKGKVYRSAAEALVESHMARL